MRYPSSDDNVNDAIKSLLDQLELTETSETYIEQLLATVVKLSNEDVDELELKILTNALKEIRYAFKIFRDYQDKKKISVFGSARSEPDNPNYQAAEKFSSLAVEQNYMVISGAGPGIMEATNKGAGKENSFGLQISIPYEYKPNPYIRDDKKCIHFRYFFSRKLLFSKESSASVYFPGGFGTHDELFELLCLMQTGRHHLTPLILCDRDGYWEQFLDYTKENLLNSGTISETDLQLLDYVQDPAEVLNIVEQFYSNYHSSRFLDEEYLIRFREYPSDRALDKLEEEFLHLCPESGFRIHEGPLDGEEPDAPEEMYRLVFYFTNQDYGELRRLVGYINEWN
jgi:uncharacterized protein (TIGR00730 family)